MHICEGNKQGSSESVEGSGTHCRSGSTHLIPSTLSLVLGKAEDETLNSQPRLK